MSAALWGVVAALAFGGADFCGRLTGRALGPHTALLWVMAVGAVVLSAALPLLGGWPPLTGPALAWALAAGLAATVAPLFLYRALTLGPMSLVGPICGAYPALVLPATLLLGATLTLAEGLAMAATLGGVVLVARTAADDPESALAADPANRRRAIGFAAAAAVLFAAAVMLSRPAVAGLGAGATVWLGRWEGVVLLGVLLLRAGTAPRRPGGWWPVLLVQGLLDAGGFLALFLGSRGADAGSAAVASSGFMVVAVLLARLILKETVPPACWLGIALVTAGVAVLSTAGG